MKLLKGFYDVTRILAVVALLAGGLLESIYHPGPLDILNALGQGLAIFIILRAPTIERNLGKLKIDENV